VPMPKAPAVNAYNATGNRLEVGRVAFKAVPGFQEAASLGLTLPMKNSEYG